MKATPRIAPTAWAGIIIALSHATLSVGDNIYWNAASGDWFTAANWSPQQVPTGSDDAYIERTGGGIAIISSGTATASDLYISRGNELRITGGTLNMNVAGRQQLLGYRDGTSGTINQTDGANSIGNVLRLGSGSGSTGTYLLGGGSLYVDDALYVGSGANSVGLFLQSGGSVEVKSPVYVGYGSGSTGIYRLSGTGTLTVNSSFSIDVGRDGGPGRFEWFREGGITASQMRLGSQGTLALGYHCSSIPSIVQGLSSATLEITNGATFTKSDSGGLGTYHLRVGSSSGSGTAIIGAGTVNVGQTMWVGDGGTGAVTQDGGGVNVTVANLYVGHAGGNGTYTLNGGTLNLGNSNLFAGSASAPDGSTGRVVLRGGMLSVNNIFMPHASNANSTGTLVLDGGTLTLNGTTLRVTNLVLGEEAGRSGSYVLTSGKTLTAAEVRVGDQGTGVLTQTDGTADVTDLYLGKRSTGVGTYQLRGGTLNVARVRGGEGNGTLELDGGTFSCSDIQGANLRVGTFSQTTFTQSGQHPMYAIPVLTLGDATYNLEGGALVVNRIENAPGLGVLNWKNGVFSVGGDIDLDEFGFGAGASVVHFQQSDKTYNIGTLRIGNGEYTLSGGTLNVGTVAKEFGGGLLSLNGGVFNPSGNVDVGVLFIGQTNSASYTISSGVWTADQLYLGMDPGVSGSLTLASGGTLSANEIGLGFGSGTLVLNGGSLTLGTGTLSVSELAVGLGTTASHIQSGKTYNVIGGNLIIGSGAGANATYRLENSATLNVGNRLYVGHDNGWGRFEWFQEGGLQVNDGIWMGTGSELAMGADFDTGSLAGDEGIVKGLGNATLEVTKNATATHDRYTVGVHTLRLGSAQGAGTYRLAGEGVLNISSGGQLLIGNSQAGGTGRFEWYREGGLSAPELRITSGSTLAMGADFGVAALANGTLFGGALYGLDGATLEVTHGATAQHNEGTLKVDRVVVGSGDGSGVWQMTGGELTVGEFLLGQGSVGTLSISGGEIRVARELTFGKHARLEVPMDSASVRLIGTDVKLLSQTPSNLSDMTRLTLIFAPEVGASQGTLEVGGRDLGPTMDGFVDNFALGGLVVGESGRPTMVKLVDLVRNQVPGGEVLYVHSIRVGPGSTLDLNGLGVYYSGEFINQGQVINGMPVLIPEPLTLGHLLAGAGVIGWASRRRGRR